MADEAQNLLANGDNKSRTIARCLSNAQDELHTFRTWLKWLCVDQSDVLTAALSWIVFLGMAIVVPAVSHFVLTCADSDALHSRPYDTVAQLSLSGVAAISFVSLSTFVRRYGLRRFLFFDKLRDVSETVRNGYTQQFNMHYGDIRRKNVLSGTKGVNVAIRGPIGGKTACVSHSRFSRLAT